MIVSDLRGGLFQIRTGVDGFADRCLTTRLRDQFGGKDTKKFISFAISCNIYLDEGNNICFYLFQKDEYFLLCCNSKKLLWKIKSY